MPSALLTVHVVVHELDGLKKEEDNTGLKARLAIRFIDDVQTAKEKWMRIQSHNEVLQNISLKRPLLPIFYYNKYSHICLLSHYSSLLNIKSTHFN